MKKYNQFLEQLQLVNALVKKNGSKYIFSHESRDNHRTIALYMATEAEAAIGGCTKHLTTVKIDQALMYLHGAFQTAKYIQSFS